MSVVVANPKNANEVSFDTQQRLLEQQKQEEEELRQKARKSPFSNFYQVNINESPALRKCLDENPKALKLLFFIFDHMDNYNAVICSYQVFQEALGMSGRTVSRAIKYLKDNGFIYIYKSGSSNVYIANKNLVWRSWGTNYQYCEFPANIVLSASEQEERLQVRNKRMTIIQAEEA